MLWGRKCLKAFVNFRLDCFRNIPRHSLKSLYQHLQTCWKVTFDATEYMIILCGHFKTKSAIVELWNMEPILWKILYNCQKMQTSKILLELSAFIFAIWITIWRGKFNIFRPLKHLIVLFFHSFNAASLRHPHPPTPLMDKPIFLLQHIFLPTFS